MLGRIKEDTFIHCCKSCGSKRELDYNEVRITSRTKRAMTAQINCECGAIEGLTSLTKTIENMEFFLRLNLRDE